LKVVRAFTCKPRPESGLDCLICARFARHLFVEAAANGVVHARRGGQPPLAEFDLAHRALSDRERLGIRSECGTHTTVERMWHTQDSRANVAHTRQPRPDSGRGFQVQVLKTFQVVPDSLGSGDWTLTGGAETMEAMEGRLHLNPRPCTLNPEA